MKPEQKKSVDSTKEFRNKYVFPSSNFADIKERAHPDKEISSKLRLDWETINKATEYEGTGRGTYRE